MTDAQAAADLNLINRPAEVPVPGLETDIRNSGKWTEYRERSELQTVAGTYDNPAMREFLDLFYSSVNQGSTRTSEGYISTLVDSMVAEGSMGPAVGAALKAYDNDRQSRGAEIGFGAVREGDVNYARAL